MKNFKKKLNIEIEDLAPNEEDEQVCQINSLLACHSEKVRKINDLCGPGESLVNYKESDSYDSGASSLLKDLVSYMEEEHKDSDLSYKWYDYLIQA
jgi:hypothetical protein